MDFRAFRDANRVADEGDVGFASELDLGGESSIELDEALLEGVLLRLLLLLVGQFDDGLRGRGRDRRRVASLRRVFLGDRLPGEDADDAEFGPFDRFLASLDSVGVPSIG